MYTAKLSLSSENVDDVLAVASFLQMQDIITACHALKSLAEPTTSPGENTVASAAEGERLAGCSRAGSFGWGVASDSLFPLSGPPFPSPAFCPVECEEEVSGRPSEGPPRLPTRLPHLLPACFVLCCPRELGACLSQTSAHGGPPAVPPLSRPPFAENPAPPLSTDSEQRHCAVCGVCSLPVREPHGGGSLACGVGARGTDWQTTT